VEEKDSRGEGKVSRLNKRGKKQTTQDTGHVKDMRLKETLCARQRGDLAKGIKADGPEKKKAPSALAWADRDSTREENSNLLGMGYWK